MSCQRCGRQANGRLCRDCERDEKFGNAGADQSQPDRGDLRHECTECNTAYETDGSDDCPNCGSSRRRFVGDETEQAAGHREIACPTHPDARVKACTRNDMVGCPVTIYRCFECGDELTPRTAEVPTERVATDGGVDQSTSGTEREHVVSDAKDLNNHWRAESTMWGVAFRVDIVTEGNESVGEVPHTNADIALGDYLTTGDHGFCGKGRPDAPDGVTVRAEQSKTWSIEGEGLVGDTDLTLTLAGDRDIVNDEFDDLVDAIGDSIPDEWEAGR